MSVFVRGLWGDSCVRQWPKAVSDCAKCICYGKHPNPAVAYCYGRLNWEFLQWFKQRPILMSDENVSSWGISGERKPATARNPRRAGRENWGVSIWRHKLAIIRRAVEEHGEVVWLDWDCWQVLPLPGDFWKRHQQGPPLQASLLKFPHKTVSPWREGTGRHYHVHGAYIYCRSVKVADELLQLSEQHPTLFDEHLIGMWVERQWGGWRDGDEDRWVEEGWEPPFYGNKRQHRMNWAHVFREGGKLR